jgi:enoyl-CoA hydratase
VDYTNLQVNKEPPLGYIIINRPDKLNALSAETIKDLYSAFLSFREDAEVRVVILSGSGEKAFAAGADISELALLDQAEGRDYALEGQELTKLIENYRKPIIAAINGFALGGGTELALSCHIRIASENAKLGQPEVKLGLIPGFGGTQRLARLVGKGKAMELILSGKMIDAQQALAIGLVNHVVPLSKLMETSEAVAKEIADNAPLALAYCIKAINEGLDKPLSEGLLLEADLFGNACSTDDGKEGTQAFLEKRKANFEGK